MNIELDCRGQLCPTPVVRAKKSLKEMDEGNVILTVDNKTAVGNLQALAATLKYPVTAKDLENGLFEVTITKEEVALCAASTDISDMNNAPAAGSTVVVIGSEIMGQGDDEVGKHLMKTFIYTLTQLDELPDAILMYNSGVKMACTGSEAIDDLKALAAADIYIGACGLCLEHYGLLDELQVGEVTNMFTIVERQAQAGRILRP